MLPRSVKSSIEILYGSYKYHSCSAQQNVKLYHNRHYNVDDAVSESNDKRRENKSKGSCVYKRTCSGACTTCQNIMYGKRVFGHFITPLVLII